MKNAGVLPRNDIACELHSIHYRVQVRTHLQRGPLASESRDQHDPVADGTSWLR